MYRYGRPFFCHRDQMWRDSWTYGDHRQYICNRPNGETQCAKVSDLIAIGGGFGAALLCLVLLSIYAHLSGGVALRWWVVGLFTFVGLAALYPMYQYARGLCLMVPVGPMNEGARRVCPWDLKP